MCIRDRVKSPGFMDSDRVVYKFLEHYYEENGNSIKIKQGEYYKVGDENIALYLSLIHI